MCNVFPAIRNDPIYKNMELWQDTVKKQASVSNACLGERVQVIEL